MAAVAHLNEPTPSVREDFDELDDPAQVTPDARLIAYAILSVGEAIVEQLERHARERLARSA